VEEARKRNDVVVASIFVNPTQFGKNEDLDKYPRQLERDLALLSQLQADHVFAPANETMYDQRFSTYVHPAGFDDIAEGRARPGHFRGVATIVTKLFNVVRPTRAYFGRKDAAQCVLIRRVVEDLNIPTDVVVLDTVREPNGLAMSSRNAYLTREEREAAGVIYRSLDAAKRLYCDLLQTAATVPSDVLAAAVQTVLRTEPFVSEIQYVSVDDKDTMKPLTHIDRSGAIISLACKIGSVRLIDNIVL